ncbi:MAG: hypothetical protein IKR38_09330 [Bacteroidales bacterium]|nr:hypothetical protein [Bacteroidales bacterium]
MAKDTDFSGFHKLLFLHFADSSALKGLLMAGSYIRPFTVDLSYTWQF